jgi:hypothetical protein
MPPEITHYLDMDFVAESFDPVTSDFLYTTFALIEKDDAVFFGQLAKRKLQSPSRSIRLPSCGFLTPKLTPSSPEAVNSP